MKNNYKKVIKSVSITEYKNLEIYLEKMAAKGLLLSEIKGYFFIFEKTKALELDFNVSLFYHTTPFDYPDGEKEKDFRELCKDCGWTFCTSNNLYQIFYKEKNVDAIPVHTDSNEEYRIIKSTFLKTDFIAMPLVILYIIMGIMNILNFDYEDLLSNNALFNLIWPIFITVIWITMFSPPVIWFIKNKINLSNGRELTFFTDKQIKTKKIIACSLMIIYVFLFLFSLIGVSMKAFLLVFLIILIILPIIITLLCIKRFKTKKRTRKQNILFYSLAVLLTMIISTLGIILMMSPSAISSSMRFNDNAPGEIKVLELSDFGTQSTPERSRVYEQKSIFTPVNLEYYESLGRRTKDSEIGSVRTTYIECINENIANYIFEGYMKKERERLTEYLTELREYNKGILFDEENYISDVSTGAWNIDKGYYLLENKNKIIIMKDIMIYILESDVDFSKSEIIEICKEKLGIINY